MPCSSFSGRRAALLASVASVVALANTGPARATDITTTVTSQQTLTDGSTLTVTDTGSLSVNSTAVTSNVSLPTGVTITNSGIIESTQTNGRAINFGTGGGNTRNITINNNAGGVIQSQDDAIRVQVASPTGSITINNAGTIQSTVGGQAIDFGAITGGTATIEINNLSTGLIQSFGGDAVRPGQNSVVTNWGTIASYNGTNDGIDFQDTSGTVINKSGGLITAARHGVNVGSNGNATVYNEAGGWILGRNGSGVGSDNTATVVNYGRITGAYNNSGTGDGDGVDIDKLADITNYGIIEGTGADGVTNFSEGIAVGGGTIVNAAGALISGYHNGILVDDGNKGSAYYATTLTNAGTIQGLNGFGIQFIGSFDDTITNSGTIYGSNGNAIDMGAGADTLNVLAGSKITGLVTGGADSDTLNYNKIGLTEAKRAALQAGETVNIGGTLYTSFETVNGTAQSFSSFATNGASRGVASILDNGSTTVAASQATVALIDAVASASDVGAALSQLSPTAFQNFTSIGANVANQTGSMIGERLDALRSGGPSFNVAALQAIGFLTNGRSEGATAMAPAHTDITSAYAGAIDDRQTLRQHKAIAAIDRASAGEAFASVPVAGSSPWGIFVNGNLSFTNQGARADAAASRYTTGTAVAGIDYRFTDRFTAGVLGGFSRTKADLDEVGSTSTIVTLLAGLYGGYTADTWFAKAVVLYGYNSYDTTRVALGTTNLSQPHGDQFAVQGAVGSDLRFGHWVLTPEIGAQFSTVSVDSYVETGPAALAVESDKADSFRTSVGAKLRTDWDTAWGRLTPEWRASWLHEFLDSQRDISASFVDPGLPGTFLTTTAGNGRDFGVLGFGLSRGLGERGTIAFNYDLQVGGDDFTAHVIGGRVRQVF